MTERLRAVVLAAEQLSLTEQDTLADQIARLLPPLSSVSSGVPASARRGPRGAAVDIVDFSVFADLPEDAVDVLDRMRHEAAPTPLYEEE